MKTENLIIFHPSNRQEIKALKIKFEISKEKPYNPEFVEKIERSKNQLLEGKDIVINTDDLWN